MNVNVFRSTSVLKLVPFAMSSYLLSSSASVAVTVTTGVPGGSSSASSTSYCGGEKTGSLSFTSWITNTTDAVAERGGVPPSVAVTWR